MVLNVVIDEKKFGVDVPNATLKEAETFFQKMDNDMDQGWQMSRQWINSPNTLDRCKIAADKLLNATSTENETLVNLMAGYILTRLPTVKSVNIDTTGDMLATVFSTSIKNETKN